MWEYHFWSTAFIDDQFGSLNLHLTELSIYYLYIIIVFYIHSARIYDMGKKKSYAQILKMVAKNNMLHAQHAFIKANHLCTYGRSKGKWDFLHKKEQMPFFLSWFDLKYLNWLFIKTKVTGTRRAL